MKIRRHSCHVFDAFLLSSLSSSFFFRRVGRVCIMFWLSRAVMFHVGCLALFIFRLLMASVSSPSFSFLHALTPVLSLVLNLRSACACLFYLLLMNSFGWRRFQFCCCCFTLYLCLPFSLAAPFPFLLLLLPIHASSQFLPGLFIFVEFVVCVFFFSNSFRLLSWLYPRLFHS